MDRFLIIDGSALLMQSFYGMPNKIKNTRGQNIEAAICFTGILFKTIKALKPNKLLVVFDGENHLSRQDIDKNYKANRTDFSTVKEEENPFAQLELIKQILDYLKIKNIETIDCEADDYIAGITNKTKETHQVIISSSDRDFFQLICENVSVFVYRGKISKEWNFNEVMSEYEIDPRYFTTLKAIVGDSSDNISGVAKIGIKTATKLIQRYGELENIISNINNLDNSKVATLLNENIVKLRTNYNIIDLKQKYDCQFDIKECEFLAPQITTMQILQSLKLN